MVSRLWVFPTWALPVTNAGVPYGSMNDLYDTNYEYEFGDIQARDEVLITKTPQFLSEPSELVSDTDTDAAADDTLANNDDR